MPTSTPTVPTAAAKPAKATSKKTTPTVPPVTTATTNTAPRAVPKAQRKTTKEREVKWNTYTVRIQYDQPDQPDCHGALTQADCKDMLGWEELPPERASEAVPELEKLFGKMILMKDNPKNRWITPAWIEELAQEHLQRRWQRTGEAISIGKTGIVMSGQHRLVSAIYAEHLRQKAIENGKGHWDRNWPGEVTLETVVFYGADESDEVFAAMNRGRPNTFEEVLFRSEFLRGYPDPEQRKELSRVLGNALRFVWSRTGMRKDTWASKLTHAEGIDFIHRHKHLITAAEHVWEEDKKLKISTEILSRGYAAGLLFLMAASSGDGTKYLARHGDERTQKQLNWDMMAKAKQFFSLLAKEGELRHEVLAAIKALPGVEADQPPATPSEQVGILIKAWNLWSKGKHYRGAIHIQRLPSRDKPLIKVQAEFPTLNGIDLGEGRTYRGPKDDKPDEEGEEGDEAPEQDQEGATANAPETDPEPDLENLSPEEIQQRAEEARAQTEAEKERRKANKKANKELLRQKNVANKNGNGEGNPGEDANSTPAAASTATAPAPRKGRPIPIKKDQTEPQRVAQPADADLAGDNQDDNEDEDNDNDE